MAASLIALTLWAAAPGPTGPEGWVRGRLLVTAGLAARSAEQLAGLQVNVQGSAPVVGQLHLSGAYYPVHWLGVSVEGRVDSVGLAVSGGQDRLVNHTFLSADVLASGRWQPVPALGLEGQVGVDVSRLPYLEAGPVGPSAVADTGRGAVGPVLGLVATLEPGRWLSAQLFIRGGLSALPRGELAGLWAAVGAQLRVLSFAVGPFSLGVALFAEYHTVRVGLGAPDGTFQSVRLGLGGAVETRTPAAVAERAPAVRGRVTREDGSPVGGATITAGDRELTADADGRFELDLPPGKTAVTVAGKGLSPRTVVVVVEPGASIPLAVTLEPRTGPGTVSGTVKASGQPLAGARVTAGATTVTTGREGTYTLDRVGPGPVKVGVKAPGFADAEEVVQVPAEGTATLDVALSPLTRRARAELRGIISGPSGTVPGAVARIAELKLRQVVKRDGRFSIEVPRGKYTLIIEARGYVTQSRTVEVGDGDQAIFQIELEKAR